MSAADSPHDLACANPLLYDTSERLAHLAENPVVPRSSSAGRACAFVTAAVIGWFTSWVIEAVKLAHRRDAVGACAVLLEVQVAPPPLEAPAASHRGFSAKKLLGHSTAALS